MRKALLILALLSVSYSAQAQRPDLDKLIEEKRFTELRDKIRTGGIAESHFDLYQCVVLNVFGRAAESNKVIDRILTSGGKLSDSAMNRVLETQHSNYVKLFNYKKAYETKKYLMDKYLSFTKEEDRFDEQQSMNIWQSIQDVAPQQVIQSDRVEIPITIDPILKLQRIPLKKNGTEYSFIFDTGAGISTTTDSMAEVLGLKIYDKVPVVIKGGLTGMGTNVRLGIADKIMIGAIEVRNVLFLVFPDKALTFEGGPNGTLKLDAILGFPVIKELGTLTLYSNKMVISKDDAKDRYRSNMAIEYLKPIIYFNYEGEDLPFTFDSGADQTVLTEVFYNKYKLMVDAEGKKKKESYGGAGGIKEFNVLVLPSLKFTSLGENIILKQVSVSTDAIHTGDDVYYGNLGQDLIKQYKSMTINFHDSWIKFNN
jgi:hypothetical protein